MCLCQIARTHYLQEYNDPLYKKRNFNTCATRFPCRTFMRKSITINPRRHGSNYEDKIQTDLIVLDFRNAFDVVPHQRLLHKLDHYEIRGCILTTRSQKVVVDGSFSETDHVRSGVPQGTLLVLILFLFYINDLPSSVSSDARLFADDCLLYRPIRTKADKKNCRRT